MASDGATYTSTSLIPSDDATCFGTLERCFRDLVWAASDASRQGDHDAVRDFVAAGLAVKRRMERAHPSRFASFWQRLELHMGLREDGGLDSATLMRPTVVNRNHYKVDDEFILPRPYIFIGQGTPLASAFEDDPSHLFYKQHLWSKIRQRDEATLRMMAMITWSTNLVCSCAPDPCHGHAVVQAWVWLQRQQWWSPDEYR